MAVERRNSCESYPHISRILQRNILPYCRPLKKRPTSISSQVFAEFLFRMFIGSIAIQFHSRVYGPKDDHRLYVLELKNLLHKADSKLDATAQDAMVIRQLLTCNCLQADLKLALLQNNAMPTMQDVINFLLQKRVLP